MALEAEVAALRREVESLRSELSRITSGAFPLLALKAGAPAPPAREGVVSLFVDETDLQVKAIFPDGAVQAISPDLDALLMAARYAE